jgi:NADH dehydrogenase (ubiquinone) Fe-S protein 1
MPIIYWYLLLQTLAQAKNPMVVVGSSALQRDDGTSLYKAVSTIAQNARVQCGCGEDWKVLNVLHRVSTVFSWGYHTGKGVISTV